jgi:hypothetical protein
MIRSDPRSQPAEPRVSEVANGPVSFSDILATAVATGRLIAEPPESADEVPITVDRSADRVGTDAVRGEPMPWMLHETQSLRQPVYRTESTDQLAQPVGKASSEPEQLPLIRYEYGEGTAVISRLGELSARDLRVMSVLSQVFFENGCPADNMVRGDEATLGFIARQLGMNPDGCAGMIRASIERLSTSKIVWKNERTIVGKDGTIESQENSEVAHGFLAGWGRRNRKTAGRAEQKDNYVLIDQHMADLIRAKNFTWLRGDVMRSLRNNALATKLYSFMRTHRPNDKGVIEYGVMLLADRLGCSDTKKSRVRTKMAAAADAVVAAAPHEFPDAHIRQGVRDHVLVMHKRLNVAAPPLVVLKGKKADWQPDAPVGRQRRAAW